MKEPLLTLGFAREENTDSSEIYFCEPVTGLGIVVASYGPSSITFVEAFNPAPVPRGNSLGELRGSWLCDGLSHLSRANVEPNVIAIVAKIFEFIQRFEQGDLKV